MSTIDFEKCKTQLANNAQRIHRLIDGVKGEQARWKPDPDSWSILEVITHLYDEEREDFRPRLDVILHKPDRSWSPIDPQGWVTSRKYNQQELQQSLNNYLRERERSLDWLNGLSSPDWQATYDAPWGSPITAGDMFAAWVAHDLLHMRQLVELHWAYTMKITQPFNPQYAGEW